MSSCMSVDHKFVEKNSGLSFFFLPAFVLAEQSVAVGAIVLSHVEGRAAERHEATWPTTEK